MIDGISWVGILAVGLIIAFIAYTLVRSFVSFIGFIAWIVLLPVKICVGIYRAIS